MIRVVVTGSECTGKTTLARALAEHYDEQARRQYGNVDALFMVATLRYLLGNDSAAHYAIDVGINLGDNDESAHILRSLIEASPADRTLRRAQ